MKQCAYCQNGACIILNLVVKEPQKCHCPHYKSELIACAKCQGLIIGSPIYDVVSEKFYCGNCITEVQ